MTKLVPLLCICLALAALSEHYSEYDTRKECYIYKDRVFFFLLTCFMVVFAGLRTAYNDTESYIGGFETASPTGIFTGIKWNLGDYPGFFAIRNIIKINGFSAQVFIFVFALFTIGIHLWFIRKYTNNIFLSVFLFFTMGCLGFTMGAMKQTASIAICLLAVDQQIQKRYGRCIILVLVASLFHPFSLMFLITPLLEFRPWGKRTLFLIAGAVILGFSMQSWLGRVLDFVSLMGKDYDEALLVGEGVNLFRLAVMWAPVVLSLATLPYWDKRKDNRIQYLMINLMMLNAAVMFVAMFGNPVYFGRLANYFLIFQVIGLTYLIQYFDSRSRYLMTFVLIICYLAYYYYGNVLSGTPFDQAYSSINIRQFLTGIRG